MIADYYWQTSVDWERHGQEKMKEVAAQIEARSETMCIAAPPFTALSCSRILAEP